MADVEKKVIFNLEAKVDGYMGALASARQATKDATDAITGSFNTMGSGINKVIGVFGAFTGILAGGAAFKSIVSETTTWITEVGKLSRTLGISAEQASVLKVAAHGLGIETDTVSTAALRLAKSINSDGGAAIERLGVSVKDSNGNLRNSVDIMMEVNSALSHLKGGTDRNTAGLAVYGKAWGEMQSTIRMNTEKMEEARKTAEKFHMVFSSQNTAEVREYKEQLNEVKLASESLGINVGRVLIPELTRLELTLNDSLPKAIGGFINHIDDVHAELIRMAMLVDRAGGSLTTFGYIFAKVAELTTRFITIGQFGDSFKKAAEEMDAFNKTYASRYAAGDKELQRIANAEMGLDADGKRIVVKDPREGAPAPPKKPKESPEADLTAQMYSKYTSAWENLNKQIEQNNPYLTAAQHHMAGINTEIAKAIEENPLYAEELRKQGDALKRNAELTESLKEKTTAFTHSMTMADMEQQIKQAEMAQDLLDNTSRGAGSKNKNRAGQEDMLKDQANYSVNKIMEESNFEINQAGKTDEEKFRLKEIAAEKIKALAQKLQNDLHNIDQAAELSDAEDEFAHQTAIMKMEQEFMQREMTMQAQRNSLRYGKGVNSKSEVTILREQATAEEAELDRQMNHRLATQQLTEAQSLALQQETAEKRKIIEQRYEADVLRLKMSSAQTLHSMQMTTMSSGVALLEQIGKKNQAAAIAGFAIQKVVALGEAFVATGAAAAKAAATASVGGPAAATAAGAEVWAWGDANMAAMAAVDVMSGISSFGGSSSSSGSSSGSSYGSSNLSDSVVTQPSGGTNRGQGSVTVQIMGNVIGQDDWVETSLIPSLNDALGRNVTLNIPGR